MRDAVFFAVAEFGHGAQRKYMNLRLLILALLIVAAPAAAADGIQIPEPSNMALMALGLVGLVVGRHAARSKRPKDEAARKASTRD